MTRDTTMERTGAPAELPRYNDPFCGRATRCASARRGGRMLFAGSAGGILLYAVPLLAFFDVGGFTMGLPAAVGCLIGSMVGMVGGHLASDFLGHDSDCVANKDQDRNRTPLPDYCRSCGNAVCGACGGTMNTPGAVSIFGPRPPTSV